MLFSRTHSNVTDDGLPAKRSKAAKDNTAMPSTSGCAPDGSQQLSGAGDSADSCGGLVPSLHKKKAEKKPKVGSGNGGLDAKLLHAFEQSNDDAETSFCLSLVDQLRRLCPRTQAMVCLQMQQLLFDAEFSMENTTQTWGGSHECSARCHTTTFQTRHAGKFPGF